MARRNNAARCEDESPRQTDIAVSLIGVTAGLEVCTFAAGDPELPPDAWIELTPAEAVLSADHDVYVIRRRLQRGQMTTWIGIYRQAQEIDRDRPGNYYGAGLWLVGHADNAQGADILAVLEALRKDLLERDVLTAGRFTRRLADARHQEMTHMSSVADVLQRIYDSLLPGPPADESALANAPTGYVDATTCSDAGITPQWLLEWALDGTALFGAYSRVVIHTHPRTLSQAHRASLPNVVSLRELRKMSVPSQAATSAESQAAIPRLPRTGTRRRRQHRNVPDGKAIQAQLSYPDRANTEEEQQAQPAPLSVTLFDPRTLPRHGGRKTPSPMNDDAFTTIMVLLAMLICWMTYYAVTE